MIHADRISIYVFVLSQSHLFGPYGFANIWKQKIILYA
jgi:hypothetical protein